MCCSIILKLVVQFLIPIRYNLFSYQISLNTVFYNKPDDIWLKSYSAYIFAVLIIISKKCSLKKYEVCMNSVRYVLISADEEGQRLDNFLIRTLKGVPKTHIYRIIRQGEVRINKGRAKASTKICAGDEIRIPPIRTSAEKNTTVKESLSKKLLDSITYEDENLLVINKPSGLAVHGGSGLSLGVIEALRKIRTDIRFLELVHRLDKNTSGCLIIAKKRSVLRRINELLAQRKVKKVYRAILKGPWEGHNVVKVKTALKKNVLKSGERMVTVDEEGKDSETTFRLLENFKNACFVEAYPLTGRTHQIRVHSAHINHPIIGDDKYGGRDQDLPKRLYLHAYKISFMLEGKQYAFTAQLDDSFNIALEKLK